MTTETGSTRPTHRVYAVIKKKGHEKGTLETHSVLRHDSAAECNAIAVVGNHQINEGQAPLTALSRQSPSNTASLAHNARISHYYIRAGSKQ